MSLETFDHSPIDHDWSINNTYHCNSMTMLRVDRGEASKTYSSLPNHSQVRVQATLHFVDDWQGEFFYMKVNDKYAFTSSHNQVILYLFLNIFNCFLFFALFYDLLYF